MQVAKKHIDVWFHLGYIMCEPHVYWETCRFLYVHIRTWKSTEKGYMLTDNGAISADGSRIGS